MSRPQALLTGLAALALASCQLTDKSAIRVALKANGLTGAQAECVVNGVAGSLDADRLDRLGGIIRANMLALKRSNDPGHLVEWLAPALDDRTVEVIDHYIQHCGRGN